MVEFEVKNGQRARAIKCGPPGGNHGGVAHAEEVGDGETQVTGDDCMFLVLTCGRLGNSRELPWRYNMDAGSCGVGA